MTSDKRINELSRGMLPFAGLRIVETHDLPKVFSHTDTVKVPGHPFIMWLATWINFDPYVYAYYKRYKDGDPVMDKKRNIIYMSPGQARLLDQIQTVKDRTNETNRVT